MARGLFISFQHNDRNRARGFTLLHHSKYVDLNFRGRHLLDPVNSENQSYIREKVREQLHGTSVTVVLLGENTCDSKWVEWEIKESIERGNGVVAIKLKDQDCPLPDKSPVAQALKEAGAEIMDWEPHEIQDAVERAAMAAGRAAAIKKELVNSSDTGTCSR
ncbi:MAG TPA: TIR domain-containing protein [Mucilaginibacter sp.]|nr:TIR domain-containing protein [Mucilaginibacter sp.]